MGRPTRLLGRNHDGPPARMGLFARAGVARFVANYLSARGTPRILLPRAAAFFGYGKGTGGSICVAQAFIPILRERRHRSAFPDIPNNVRRRSPESLRREAAKVRAERERLANEMRLELRRLDTYADALETQASGMEDLATKMPGDDRGLRSGKSGQRMTPSQRKVRSIARVDPRDEFMVAVHRRYPSLTSLAKDLGVSVQFLSRIRTRAKRMPAALADEIERLTGYGAANWFTSGPPPKSSSAPSSRRSQT